MLDRNWLLLGTSVLYVFGGAYEILWGNKWIAAMLWSWAMSSFAAEMSKG